MYGVALAVKESICRKSVYTHQFIDERLMSMRFELTGVCAAVDLVVAYAPTQANPKAELKEVFWEKLWHLVKTDSNKGYAVCTDRRKCTDWEKNGRVR